MPLLFQEEHAGDQQQFDQGKLLFYGCYQLLFQLVLELRRQYQKEETAELGYLYLKGALLRESPSTCPSVKRVLPVPGPLSMDILSGTTS